jgi:hypothetical protein
MILASMAVNLHWQPSEIKKLKANELKFWCEILEEYSNEQTSSANNY